MFLLNIFVVRKIHGENLGFRNFRNSRVESTVGKNHQ